MPITATCKQGQKIEGNYGNNNHMCNGTVIRWKVWGVSGRYLEECECQCHERPPLAEANGGRKRAVALKPEKNRATSK
jgi:hypothetical protein